MEFTCIHRNDDGHIEKHSIECGGRREAFEHARKRGWKVVQMKPVRVKPSKLNNVNCGDAEKDSELPGHVIKELGKRRRSFFAGFFYALFFPLLVMKTIAFSFAPFDIVKGQAVAEKICVLDVPLWPVSLVFFVLICFMYGKGSIYGMVAFVVFSSLAGFGVGGMFSSAGNGSLVGYFVGFAFVAVGALVAYAIYRKVVRR